MSELARRLKTHALGPEKCNVMGCNGLRDDPYTGCGEPCAFRTKSGPSRDSFEDPWQAKLDMLEAADRIGRMEEALKKK